MNEELKIIISAELSKFQQGVEKAKKQIKTFGDKVKEQAKKVKDDMEKIGGTVEGAVNKIGAGITALGVALIGAAVGTEEYRNQQAQLITSFEAAGQSAEAAKETYNDLYRVLGDGGQAQEAAQHLAKLGVEEKALQEYTYSLQGVYATFGASLPLEGLTEAINHTVKLGEVQGPLADALEWSGITTDAFNEQLAACNTEAEREKLIRETLTGLYSEAAGMYEKNNADVLAQRDAQAALQEQLAKVGEAVAPVITMFSQLGAELLEKIAPIIQELSEKYMPVLKEWLEKAADAAGKLITWVVDNWETIKLVGGVILAIVAAFEALNLAMKAVNAVSALFSLNPVTLAIGAVIAVIILCVAYWDEIKEAGKKAWEWIKKAWQNAGQWFKGIVDKIKQVFADIATWFSNLFSKAWNGIKSAWSGVKGWFSSLWNSIKNIFSVVGSWFSDIFNKAKTGIQNAFSGITNFFSGIWNSIKNIFSNVGSAIANGIKGAVSSAVNWILSKAASIINGFISAINFAIGIINAIPGVNIGKLTPLSVPAMAKGGIVDSATLAVIGEQGKEAVLPLENNLEYLDKLAAMLNERMGGGNRPIVLNVDGKRFAEISVESINSLTRQRGSIPLVMA